jgi:hypothetical protein
MFNNLTGKLKWFVTRQSTGVSNYMANCQKNRQPVKLLLKCSWADAFLNYSQTQL